MTLTSPAPVIEAAPAVEWRRLGRLLWAGRRDGRHVGTIEHGRRFVLTDASGEAQGAYRSFAEAAAAAEAPTAPGAPTARRASPLTAATAVAIVLAGGVAMGAGALAVLATV